MERLLKAAGDGKNKLILYGKEYRKQAVYGAARAGVRLVRFCIITGISFIVLMPVVSILVKTFMSIEDYYNPMVYMIPEHFTLFNIKTAAENMQYVKSLLVTCALSGGCMLLQAFICASVGYGFARYSFPGKQILFALVVLTIVVPVQTMMVPMYIQFRYFDLFGVIGGLTGKENGINLLNTPWPVLLMSATGMGLRSGLYIYIYRQFFKGLPKEIEEAAFIDGAGPFRTFFRVMLPNAVSSIIIVMLFSFVWQYNDTYFSGLYMSEMGLLSQKLNSLGSVLTQVLLIRDTNQVTLIINAGVSLIILPLLLVYLFMQRYFMEGIERSGIVG